MKPVKGTMDFYPEERLNFNFIRDTFVKTALSFNYKEIETPAMEEMKVLTKKSGEEIKQQIFTLDKRSKEEIGLRFDLTIPFARMYVSSLRGGFKNMHTHRVYANRSFCNKNIPL